MAYPILADAAERAQLYLAGLDRRPVAPSPAAVEALAELDVPLPDSLSDPGRTLALLDRVVSPATMGMAGPRFFGFVMPTSRRWPLRATACSLAWAGTSKRTACSERLPSP